MQCMHCPTRACNHVTGCNGYRLTLLRCPWAASSPQNPKLLSPSPKSSPHTPQPHTQSPTRGRLTGSASLTSLPLLSTHISSHFLGCFFTFMSFLHCGVVHSAGGRVTGPGLQKQKAPSGQGPHSVTPPIVPVRIVLGSDGKPPVLLCSSGRSDQWATVLRAGHMQKKPAVNMLVCIPIQMHVGGTPWGSVGGGGVSLVCSGCHRRTAMHLLGHRHHWTASWLHIAYGGGACCCAVAGTANV
jgi:hypothetical protein